MKFPNKYLRNLKPYKLASHKIWAVDPMERENILKLDWNESTMPPSPKVRERMAQLIEQPAFFNLYPETTNNALVKALADYTDLPTSNIQYFSSSDALHEYICKVFISVGDPVLILGPSYDNFRLTCQANGAEIFFSNYSDSFEFRRDVFERDIMTVEPAMVYICNPNNPTGNLHSYEYIEYLLKEFPDTLFIIDEAYYEFSRLTVKDLVLKYDNVLISRTMSKAFALANFRIGYLLASEDNVQFINKIRNPKSLSTFAQQAALASLEDIGYMWRYVNQVLDGKRYFINMLGQSSKNITIYAGHGNFSMLQFPTKEEKDAMVTWLESRNIFVRNLSHSDLLERCFRITIGTREQMSQVLTAIRMFYDK